MTTWQEKAAPYLEEQKGQTMTLANAQKIILQEIRDEADAGGQTYSLMEVSHLLAIVDRQQAVIQRWRDQFAELARQPINVIFDTRGKM